MSIDGVLAERVDVRGALHDAYAAAKQETDPEILRLVEIRVAQLLGNEPLLSEVDPATLLLVSSWPSADLSAPARACLAFTEEFVVDVASLRPETAAAVGEHLGDAGRMTFAQALLAVEQRQRLLLMWHRLGLADPDADPAALPAATTRGDALGPALGRFAAVVVTLPLIDPETTEIVRLRCASYHDCHT